MPKFDKETKDFINLIIEKDLLYDIEEYRFSNRIPNRSEAIRDLLRYALEKKKEESRPGK